MHRISVYCFLPLLALGDLHSPTQRVAGILKAADPFWFPRSTSDHITDLSHEDLQEFRTMIRDIQEEATKSSQKVHISGAYTHAWNVLLGETAGPELYQIFNVRFVTREFLRPPDMILIKAAFTMKARDAKGGISDFNRLLKNGREFIQSSLDRGLVLSPFFIKKKYFVKEKSESDPKNLPVEPFILTETVRSADIFFQKYFSVEEFTLIGLKISTLCGLSRLEPDDIEKYIDNSVDPACGSSTIRYIPKDNL